MSVEKLNDELEFAASQGPDVAVMTTQETVRAVLAEVGMIYVLADGSHVTGERAVDLYDDELQRCRRVSSELADLRAELEAAKKMLTAANKWLRLVDERRDEVPQWFRHDADSKPLRQQIDAFLSTPNKGAEV